LEAFDGAGFAVHDVRDLSFGLFVDGEGDAGVGEYAEDGGGDAAVEAAGAALLEAVGEDVADALAGFGGPSDSQFAG